MSSKHQPNRTLNKETNKNANVEAKVPKKYDNKVKQVDENLADDGQVKDYVEKQTKRTYKGSTAIKKKVNSKDSKTTPKVSNNKMIYESGNKRLPCNQNESSLKTSTKAAPSSDKKESNVNQSKAKLLVKKVKDIQQKISKTKLFGKDKKGEHCQTKVYTKVKQDVIAQSHGIDSVNAKLERKNVIDETKPLIVARTLDYRPVIVEGMQPLPPEQVASIKRRLYASIERATRIALRKESLARNSGIPSAPALIRNTRASKAKNQAIAIKYNLKKKKQVRFHEPLVQPTNSQISIVPKKKRVRFLEQLIRPAKQYTSDEPQINEKEIDNHSSDQCKTGNKQVNINDNDNSKKVQFAANKMHKNLEQGHAIEPSTSGLNQPRKGIIRDVMKYKKYIRFQNPMPNVIVRNTFFSNGLHPSDSRTLYPHLLWKNRVAVGQETKCVIEDTPIDQDATSRIQSINLQPTLKSLTISEKADDFPDEEPQEIVQYKNCRLRPPTPGPPPLAALDSDSDSEETSSKSPSQSPCSSRSYNRSRSLSHSSDSSSDYYTKSFRKGLSYDREKPSSSKQGAMTLQQNNPPMLHNKTANKKRSLAMDNNKKVAIGSKSRSIDVARHKTNKPSLGVNKKETKEKKGNIVRKSYGRCPIKTGNIEIVDTPTTPLTPLKQSNCSEPKVPKLRLTTVPSTYLDNQFACRQPIFSNENLLLHCGKGLGKTDKITKPTKISVRSKNLFTGKKFAANRKNLGVAAFGNDLDLQMKFYEDQVLNSIGGSVIRSVTNSIKKNNLNKSKSKKKTIVKKDKPVQFSQHELDVLEKKGYILGDRIARNRDTAVHLAIFTDQTTNFKVKLACKVIDRSNYKSDLIKKFLPRELAIVKQLKHPNLISAHSILDCGIKSFIFVSYAERGDLLEYIRNHGSLAELHAKIWFKQIVSGANYLHNHQIVHRDLKCENILITNNYSLQISDFRLARNYTANQGLSQTYCGSASYCAPEVISCQPYDPKTADVWSLGVILYIMLNGSMPFSDSSLLGLLRNQFNRNWAFRPGLTRTLSRPPILIIERCLEPDVSLRYSMSQLATSEFLSLDLEFKRIGAKGFVDLYLRQLPKFFSDPIRKVKEVTSSTEEKYKAIIKKFISQHVKNKRVKPQLKEKKTAKVHINIKHTIQNQPNMNAKQNEPNEKHKLKSSSPNRTMTKTSLYHKTCLNPSRNNYNPKLVNTIKRKVFKVHDNSSACLVSPNAAIKKRKIIKHNINKHTKGEQTN